MPYRPQNLSATDLEPAVSSIMHDDPQSGGAERRLNYYIMLYQRAHTHTHICCGNVITGRRIVEWTTNDQCSTFILLVWFTCAFFRRPAEAKYNNNIHLWIIDNDEHTHTHKYTRVADTTEGLQVDVDFVSWSCQQPFERGYAICNVHLAIAIGMQRNRKLLYLPPRSKFSECISNRPLVQPMEPISPVIIIRLLNAFFISFPLHHSNCIKH